jgi:aminoglycoside 6'-N-acetyltransferase I
MKIREAIKNDTGEWARMRNILWPDSLQQHIEEIGEFFSGTSKDIVQVFVIERVSGALAGFIEINIRNFAEGSRSSKVPYIEAWFIDEDLREQGYGRKLIEVAEKWAMESGFNELGSDAEIDNINSIEAHKKLGFKEVERVVCFLKKLR